MIVKRFAMILAALCLLAFFAAAEETLPATGIQWKTEEFVDEFDLPTGRYYITLSEPVAGKLTSDATEGDTATFLPVITKNTFGIRIRDSRRRLLYNPGSSAEAYTGTMLNPDKSKTALSAQYEPQGDILYLSPATDIRGALKQGGSVSFHLVKSSNSRVTYTFTISDTADFYGAYERVFGALSSGPDQSFSEVGRIVNFGRFEQDGDTGNGPEPIEWIVLDTDGEKSLLISRYGLMAVPYHNKQENITWQDCALRTWLNGAFFEGAFSASEQSAIRTTEIDNGPSQCDSRWTTNGGRNTRDRVFLLSVAEAEKYYPDESGRICALTKHAMANGAVSFSGNGWWWLRSPGRYQFDAEYVSVDGSLSSNFVNDTVYAIRPVLWISQDTLPSIAGN